MFLRWYLLKVDLLNKRGGWFALFIFCERITSWACLDGSGLRDIFHLLAQRLTLSRSLFSFCEVLIGLQTTESIEVSSAKSFTLDSRLSDKSSIYIKKSNGTRTEPWGTPALIVSHWDSCLFRTTLCCLSNKKDSIKARRSPFTPIHSIL